MKLSSIAATPTLLIVTTLLSHYNRVTATSIANGNGTTAGRDWELKLVDGYSSNEGTLMVSYRQSWGLICDDGWDLGAADTACRQMGFGRALEYSVVNKYRTDLIGLRIVLDDVVCSGRERRLSECHSRPLGQHNCKPSEAAGVRCSVVLGNGVEASRPRVIGGVNASLLRDLVEPAYRLKQLNGNSASSNSGPIFATVGKVTGALCPDRVTLREGNVLCRELGLGFAKAVWAHPLNNSSLLALAGAVPRPVLTVGNYCRGGERRLAQCVLYGSESWGSPCSKPRYTVGVTCSKHLPDLAPDPRALQTSAYIAKIPLFYMTCSMEEKCASAIAFEIRKNSPYWQYAARTLLRFSTIVKNQGNADFLPLKPSHTWEWHSCHMHYHSMAYFASYEVYQRHSRSSTTVASGHKASFCLEDNACNPGLSPKYKCSQEPNETGTQGISPGCSDNYLHDLDCQWVDITDIPFGNYRFRMVINPEYAAGEQSFENNAVVCQMHYSPVEVQLRSCRLGHPFDV